MAHRAKTSAFLIAAGLATSVALAQRGPAPSSARDSAPIDLTGYWVSVVSEDWRHRMATPRVGDFESMPLSGAGRRVASEWNLEADNAAGLQCKAFGVGGIIRQPGRLHITWEDDDTLRIDFDAGDQTRLLHFDANMPAPAEKTWQGHSIATWQTPPGRRGRGGGPGAVGAQGEIAAGGGGRGQRGGPPPPTSIYEGGSLAVMTSAFREGYLRKNGVPYSEDASITENFYRLPQQANGDVWLLVVTVIEDPMYLSQPYYLSTHFRLEPNGSGFDPKPCYTAPPPP